MAVPDVGFEELVSSVATGDEGAWRELWHRLEPRLRGLVRKRFLGDDEYRDVVVAVMARLRQHRFRRLRSYQARRRANPQLAFVPWIMVLARRVAIDCMRSHPDYVDRRRAAAGPPGVWIRRVPLLGEAMGLDAASVTTAVTARQIMRYAAGGLSDRQRRALELWTRQLTNEEIARALALDRPADAARLVHSALARLRRQFRDQLHADRSAGRESAL